MQLVRNLYLVLALVVLGGSSMQIKAQVTIGSNAQPNRAALLDIKDKEMPGINNETATTGGLLLPRVSLVNSTTLEPFVALTDANWVNASTSKIKEKHVGLQVYNLSTSNDFVRGIYVWNGTHWQKQDKAVDAYPQEENFFFYLPSFNIDIEVGTNQEIDLYDVYEKQFTRDLNENFVSNSNFTLPILPLVGAEDRLYRRDELDYVLTNYDETIIDATTIAISNDGKLTFDVISTDTSEKSYFNILFVIKKQQ